MKIVLMFIAVGFATATQIGLRGTSSGSESEAPTSGAGSASPSASPFDWAKDFSVMADIGSGGTRLIMYTKTQGKDPVQCCPKECAKEGEKQAAPNADKDIESRYSLQTTAADVTRFAEELLRKSLENMLTGACKKLVHTDDNKPMAFDVFARHAKASIVSLQATAGGRRIEADADATDKKKNYEKVMIKGFKDYFNTITTPADGTISGAVIPGYMEGYYGLISAVTKGNKFGDGTGDFKDKLVFFEVGGASQQVAWFRKAKGGKEIDGTDFKFKATQEGVFKSKWPNKVPGVKSNTVKNVYSSSILGDGGDRLVVHLVHEALRHAGNATHPAKGVVKVPCLPKGLNLQWASGKIQNNAEAPGDHGSNAVQDLSKDAMVQKFLKTAGNKLQGVQDGVGVCCKDFMKQMFDHELDEVDGGKAPKAHTYSATLTAWRTQLTADKPNLKGEDAKVLFSSGAVSATTFRDATGKAAPMTEVLKKMSDACKANTISELGPHSIPGGCAVTVEAALLIEGVFGADKAAKIKDIRFANNPWLLGGTPYAFDAKNGGALAIPPYSIKNTWTNENLAHKDYP